MSVNLNHILLRSSALLLIAGLSSVNAEEWNIRTGEGERLVELSPSGVLDPQLVRELQRGLSGFVGSNEIKSYELAEHISMGLDGSQAYATVISGVAIHNKQLGMSGELNVTTVFDDTGLLLAFTEKPGEWVLPVMEPRVVAQEIADAGWTVAPVSTELLTLKLDDVVETIWNELGIDPREIGQIVIRPARIRVHYPVDAAGDPMLNGDPGWLVHATGILVKMGLQGPPESPSYFSGFMCVMSDNETGRRILSVRYMP